MCSSDLWWKATIDGADWTDVYIENGRAQKDVSFTFVPGEVTHHSVEMWYPNVNGVKRCGIDVTIDDRPTSTPTVTPTVVPTVTATPTITPTSTPTKTPEVGMI